MRRSLWAAAVAGAAWAPVALAADPAPASAPVAAASAVPTAQAGKKHFIRCAACHAMRATDKPASGPHLQGIVGRAVAALPGFAYSSGLRAQDFRWDEAKLDAFLKSPRTTHPGMCPGFMGLSRPADRAALIAYLKDPID